MADKVRRTFSIDEDVDEWLKNTAGFNASGAVNEYLRSRKAHLGHGEATADALRSELEAKRKQAQLEAQSAESRAERFDRKLAALDSDAPLDIGADAERVVTEFVEKVENGDFAGELTTTNPAIQTKAEKANMTPGEFVAAVETRL